MEKRKWLWKKRSFEKSSSETESLESISSHSERNFDDQEGSKASPDNNNRSPEITSKAAETSAEGNCRVNSLAEKLSAALVNISAKEDLVKQHAKVAEEAVAGWEKAENEVLFLTQKLEDATKQNSSLEDRASHLDGALKECVRQLRQLREEQEAKIHEAVVKKTQDLEDTKTDLEQQLLQLQEKVDFSNSSPPASVNPEPHQKIQSLQKENSALKSELFVQTEELEIRTIERDLSTQAAEAASKQHLESIKKVAKLKAECRKLKAMVHKSSSLIDNKHATASSVCLESLTDCQSDSGERLSALEIDASKMSSSETNGCEPSCSDSLFAELDQFKNGNIRKNPASSATFEMDLMDDFLEMERLAALPDCGTYPLESEAISDHFTIGENLLNAKVEAMVHRASELEEKLTKMVAEKTLLEETLEKMNAEKDELKKELEKMEVEKAKVHDKLEKMEAEKAELEVALSKSQNQIKASENQLRGAEMKLEQLEKDLELTNESKQHIESQLISIEVGVRAMCAKVNLLEGEVEREHASSEEMAAKCRKLEDELSRKQVELQKDACSNSNLKIKQEDLALAAGKLAECQQTIASLGSQLKSLATLEDFLIDMPDFSESSNYGNSTSSSSLSSLSSNSSFDCISSKKGQNGCLKLVSPSKGDFPVQYLD